MLNSVEVFWTLQTKHLFILVTVTDVCDIMGHGFWCPRRDSNPHYSRLKVGYPASWMTRASQKLPRSGRPASELLSSRFGGGGENRTHAPKLRVRRFQGVAAGQLPSSPFGGGLRS